MGIRAQRFTQQDKKLGQLADGRAVLGRHCQGSDVVRQSDLLMGTALLDLHSLVGLPKINSPSEVKPEVYLGATQPQACR